MTATAITYDRTMGRWEPNARGRLELAALELYAANGFEQTTVAEIAARAGLTERTFFRHFADKREVLFGGPLSELFVTAVADAPPSATPLDAVAAALLSGTALIQQRRPYSLQRQAVIAANPALQERELIKLAALGDALGGRTARARCARARREPHRRDRHRCVQGRLRALDRADESAHAPGARPGIAGSAQGHHVRSTMIGREDNITAGLAR